MPLFSHSTADSLVPRLCSQWQNSPCSWRTLGYTSTKHASALWIPMKIDENPLVYQSGNEIVSLSALSPCRSV